MTAIASESVNGVEVREHVAVLRRPALGLGRVRGGVVGVLGDAGDRRQQRAVVLGVALDLAGLQRLANAISVEPMFGFSLTV